MMENKVKCSRCGTDCLLEEVKFFLPDYGSVYSRTHTKAPVLYFCKACRADFDRWMQNRSDCSGWIDIKERAPAKGSKVLLAAEIFGGYEVFAVNYNPELFGDWNPHRKVTHWQYVPKPPKEDNNE